MAEDHDLLIQLNSKVNNLCTMMQEQKNNYKEILDKFEKRDENCDTCKGGIYSEINSKVSFSLFKWVVGILGVLFLMAFVYFGTNMHFLDKQLGVLKTTVSFASEETKQD